MLLWNDNHLDISSINIGEFHVTATVTTFEAHSTFLLTVVYGPTLSSRKHAFLHELQQLKPQHGVQWLLLGDFNMIYKASDKNNTRLNTSLMRSFREALDVCNLREIHLQNRKFTWSNERQNPTLAKLDRVFCNQEWDIRCRFQTTALYYYRTKLDPDGQTPSNLKTSGPSCRVFER